MTNDQGTDAARTAMVPAGAAVTAALAEPIDIRLDAATPCADFDVRALVEHFDGTSAALGRLGLGTELDAADPWGTGSGTADAGWPARLRRNLDTIGRGWSRSEAWDGEVTVGGSTLPRALIGQMALIEIVVHGWDLARALGRRVDLDPAVANAVDEAVAATASMGRQMGAYGPEVSVPAGSSSLDRALGRAGRDPAWPG